MAREKDAAKNKVFIVDDHPVVRRGLAELVNIEPDLRVCGEAADAAGAVRGVAESRPDVAVVDLSLGADNGLELIRQLRQRHPKLCILVLSMHEEDFFAERALRAGANGYVTKSESPEQVLRAVRRSLREGMHVSERMAGRIFCKHVKDRPDGGPQGMDLLTDREVEVLQCLGRGMTTRQVAGKLGRSIKTIDSHRENIKHKLNLHNAAELLQRAVQWVSQV